MKKSIFRSPTKGPLDLEKVGREIAGFIAQDMGCRYCLVVGTDSSGERKADFVTAIIVHRIGRGGRYFWKRTNGRKIYHTLRDRIYREVTLSLKTSQDILKELEKSEKAVLPKYDFQIHIDVGQNGPTREMIKEVVGIVRGNGFEAKIKPDSFGASHIADKYV